VRKNALREHFPQNPTKSPLNTSASGTRLWDNLAVLPLDFSPACTILDISIDAPVRCDLLGGIPL